MFISVLCLFAALSVHGEYIRWRAIRQTSNQWATLRIAFCLSLYPFISPGFNKRMGFDTQVSYSKCNSLCHLKANRTKVKVTMSTYRCPSVYVAELRRQLSTIKWSLRKFFCLVIEFYFCCVYSRCDLSAGLLYEYMDMDMNTEPQLMNRTPYKLQTRRKRWPSLEVRTFTDKHQKSRGQSAIMNEIQTCYIC